MDYKDSFERLDLEHKILTAPQERRLIALAQGEGPRASRAFDQMVLQNLRLVAKEVRKQAKHGSLPADDLLQEGIIGLMKALERFELERQVRFSTYALWWIRQAIRRAQEDTSRTIRLPVHQQNRLAKLSRARSEMRASLGRDPEPQEIARSIQWSEEEVERADALTNLGLAGDPVSLEASYLADAPVGDGGFTVGDTIPADEEPVEQTIDDNYEVRCLRKALKTLSEEHRELLSRRFGFEGKKETLAEIAKEWGLSQERVRQKESWAIHKLQAHLGPMVMWYSNIGDSEEALDPGYTPEEDPEEDNPEPGSCLSPENAPEDTPAITTSMLQLSGGSQKAS